MIISIPPTFKVFAVALVVLPAFNQYVRVHSLLRTLGLQMPWRRSTYNHLRLMNFRLSQTDTLDNIKDRNLQVFIELPHSARFQWQRLIHASESITAFQTHVIEPIKTRNL